MNIIKLSYITYITYQYNSSLKLATQYRYRPIYIHYTHRRTHTQTNKQTNKQTHTHAAYFTILANRN